MVKFDDGLKSHISLLISEYLGSNYNSPPDAGVRITNNCHTYFIPAAPVHQAAPPELFVRQALASIDQLFCFHNQRDTARER